MNKFENYRIDYPAETDKKEKKEEKLTFSEIVLEIADSAKIAIVVVMLMFTFLFRAVGVDGDSMLPTCHDGDWIAVSAFVGSSGPERGDIVIITQPWDRGVPLIKRVIGVGGDTIDINFDSGDVFVNGQLIEEDYIKDRTHLYYDVTFPVQVPEGKIFAMGDNRNDSLDSRSSEVGMIDENYILGKALIRMFPFSEWKLTGGNSDV